MSEFLIWHPSSQKGWLLYDERDYIINLISRKPKKGISYLSKKWNFGKVSELWDDYIFSNCIQPALDVIVKESIDKAINLYSELDHSLFTTYIRREESPIRFRRAFWNVNVYGQRLASKLVDVKSFDKKTLQISSKEFINNSQNFPAKIAFVLKGPYKLAHVEFLHSFLQGTEIFSKNVQVTLILLDAPAKSVGKLEHISVVSFYEHNLAIDKIGSYIDLCNQSKFDHICWVACVQNLSLYMGMHLAPMQSYWSMKYHSIIMPTIQKYAGLGFGGESFSFDDTEWYRGRAFPVLSMPKYNSKASALLRDKAGLPANSLIVGCFVRAEKLHDQNFWESIASLLKFSNNIYFVIASQYLPTELNAFLSAKLGNDASRFIHLGWIETKKWVYNLDVYYDSSPRGSCNTIFEAIEANVPVLLADSEFNRESSALPYLISASKQVFGEKQAVPGVYSDEEERVHICQTLLKNKNERAKLIKAQSELFRRLNGQQHLFAKDYLNYFLGVNMTIKSL